MNKLLIAAALAAFPTVASADGCNPRLQDCYASYKDTPVAYAYAVKTARGAWPCPEEFSARECRRLRLEIASRRAREDRPRKVAGRRPVVRDTLARPARADFGGRRCIARVTVVGGQRPTEGLARGAAWKEWRSVVRASAGGGEAYMDDRYAIGERVRCHITGASRFLKRCEVSAVPCR